jgi:hypothetical protein
VTWRPGATAAMARLVLPEKQNNSR